MSKRKRTPLGEWRIAYAYASQCIRDLKQRIKTGADWGRFKGASPQQSMIKHAKSHANLLMGVRGMCVQETQELWAARQAARAAAIAANKGHNSKNAGE